MGGNRINILLASILMLAAAIWGVSFILTLQDLRHQFAILGVVLALLLILTIKPKIPIDAKMLMFVVTGYFIAGKGFAYLSPAPPVYIGEIFFLLCSVGMMLRSRFNLISICRKTPLNAVILAACVCVALRLMLFDFKIYGIMAMRDSAMVYYSFIAVAVSLILQNEKVSFIFNTWLPKIVIIGLISQSFVFLLLKATGLYHINLVKMFYGPHPDVKVPLASAVALMGFHYIGERKFKGLILLCFALVVIVTGKTAYVFAFILVAAIFLFVGRMKVIAKIGGVVTLFAVLLSAGMFVFDGDSLVFLKQSDLVGTVDALDNIDKGSTTRWRLEWWRIVFRDAYNESPLFGLGLGSDITSNFIKEYMGIEVVESHSLYLTRYPHNILFTIFGRLGFLGLIFFLLYCAVFLRFCFKFFKKLVVPPNRQIIDVLLASYVLAGFFNSFIQSTFENPYAGIPHWICLGAMMSRYTKKINSTEIESKQIL